MRVNVLPVLLSDSYKQFHHMMYPKGMIKLYSNMTPRSYKRIASNTSVFFGLQYYIKEYLVKEWNEKFFNKPWEEVEREFKRFHKSFSGVQDIDCTHIKKLHDLGYMPIYIKALPEGSKVNARVPYFTITNTHKDFGWLVNFLETQISTIVWDLCTVATISDMYKKVLMKYAEETGDPNFVQWQAHDFSMRGRSSMESACNQAGHLLSFTGTDTIPAVYFLEQYYNANMEKELIGASVPASEHSVMTAYGKEDEITAFERLLDTFSEGIISVVSDSFDLWKVCTEYVTTLKEKILARNGKLVIRPDSGDPVDIICGFETIDIRGLSYNLKDVEPSMHYGLPESKIIDGAKSVSENERKGVVELLWDIFGGTVNEKGYKVLNPHIGVIYGDSITLDRAIQICERLKAKGFASTNVVLGIGSYTFNYNTRDTLGIAIKSTYCEVEDQLGKIIEREIFKDPVTDDGVKKSAKGLLEVVKIDGEYQLLDQVTKIEEGSGELEPVFLNGVILRDHTLAEIRERVANG
jgi:nicotinamide phosphoribosyltransferase